MQTAFAFLMIYTALMCSWRSKEEHYIRTKQSLANDKPWLLKSQSCISLFTEYSWSDSTMALSLSTVQVHNGLSHQTTHSCCLFCAGISTTLAVEIKLFSFFSGINVMQHKWAFQIALFMLIVNPPLVGWWGEKKKKVCQYYEPIFTVSFILVLHGKGGSAKSKSVRRVHKWPKVISICCCSLLFLYFQVLLQCQWFVFFLHSFSQLSFFSMIILCILALLFLNIEFLKFLLCLYLPFPADSTAYNRIVDTLSRDEGTPPFPFVSQHALVKSFGYHAIVDLKNFGVLDFGDKWVDYVVILKRKKRDYILHCN